jgi:hypothetical protein
MSEKITSRAEDAESIVGKTLAESLEVNKSAAGLEDVMVIKAEAVVEDAKVKEPAEDSEEDMEEDPEDKKKVPACEKTALEASVEILLAAVEQAKSLPHEEALAKVQAELDAVGGVIKSALAPQTPIQANPELEEVKTLVAKSNADILEAISNIAARVENLDTELAILKSSNTATKIVEKSAVPAPRSAVVTERTSALAPKRRLTQIERIALQTTGQSVE